MPTTDPEPSDQAAARDDVRSDEDWKRQVKAEDAALDETLKSERSSSASDESANTETPESGAASSGSAETAAGAESSAQSAEAMPMPPATFETLVGMFSTQAMVALGMIPNPSTGKAERMPELAQHFIDLLGVVETKTAGNLEQREQSLLETSLHQLRMAYVQVTRTATDAGAGRAATEDEG